VKETKSTSCHYGAGCGVAIQSEGERIIGVRGDSSLPASFGRLCTKGPRCLLLVGAAHPPATYSHTLPGCGGVAVAGREMKFQMARDSLFAVLLRSPWWISIALAAGIVALGRVVVPEVYALYAFFAALPFIVIGGVAGWRQLRAPSAARVAGTLEAVRAMSWEDFSSALTNALRDDGYAVSRFIGAAADFELAKAGRISLVGCKRWKAARTGVDPLRDLHDAKRAREAHECIYVATGEITDGARAFALERNIRLIHGPELAKLLPRVRRT